MYIEDGGASSKRSLINFIDLFGSIKKCRTFVVCFSWY